MNTSWQWSTHSPSPVHRSWSIHTRISTSTVAAPAVIVLARTLARMTVDDGPAPPVAPTKPYTWERPTGPADDPWAWLLQRDDPETLAYLRAENAYSDVFFDEHADLVEGIFQEIKSRVQETDESVPVQHGPWWYVTRTFEGHSYPVFCRGATIDDATSTVLLDCNIEAAGHEYFDVHAVDPSPDHELLAW